jgi:uncharacterized membrane protein
MAAAPAPRFERPGRRLAGSGAVLDLILAAAIGVVRASLGSTGAARAEGPLPTIAIVAALAAPGVVALVGIAGNRPALFGAAGFACGPLILVSIVAFPILFAAALLLVAWAQATAGRRISGTDALVLVGFPIPLVFGLGILITQTSHYTYNFAGGSESGEYFTARNALLCIAIVVADVVGACALARRAPASRYAHGS